MKNTSPNTFCIHVHIFMCVDIDWIIRVCISIRSGVFSFPTGIPSFLGMANFQMKPKLVVPFNQSMTGRILLVQ